SKSIRKSSTGFVKNILEIDDRIKEAVNNHVHLKGYDFTQIGNYQFTEYKEGEYYHWHTDSEPNTIYSNRLCSMVIQLNDEYDGGNLELKIEENEIELERGKGNLYLFYSNITHRVTPIIKGTRYSLVSWITPEKNNNYKKTLL
ncbi:MAG: 2OG-Fe(II) oxygenase, partial [Rhodocyclales bacterium]|nr:2OG-Fe(II) oxygenase [Rhodocyclales bacterium]